MTTPTSKPAELGAEDWSSPFDDLLDPNFPSFTSPLASAQVRPAETQIGSPEQDIALWDGQQSYPDTCAIRCQEFILEQFTGLEVDEHALVRQAVESGLYTPGAGTAPDDVGKLLELNGIAVNRFEDASIFNLANELAQGHKVIVGLDSGEIWGEHPILESLADTFGMSGADHAVVVSGIDTSDPGNVQVIISDPGTGQPAATYPMDQFVDAWRDSNCFMVATQDPAPPHLPEMVHFDYMTGHLPMVWGMPYGDFLGLADQPDSWSGALDTALNMLGLSGFASQARQDAEPGGGSASMASQASLDESEPTLNQDRGTQDFGDDDLDDPDVG